MNPEPLLFKNNLDDSRPWGGKFICALKGIPQKADSKIGESWEISVNASHPGLIHNEARSEQTFSELIAENPEAWLGKKVCDKYANTFPLLLKILDAEDNLSVQVHPPEAYAKEHHGDPFGKEEAWYILAGSEGGCIYLGLQEGLDLKEFEEKVKSPNEVPLETLMNRVQVKSGECYFLKTGTLHALGKGVKVVEIQMDSDRTYRIYDYNRPGNDGKPRELHLERGLAVIDDRLKGRKAVDSIKVTPRRHPEGGFLHLPENSDHFQMRSIELNGKDPQKISGLGVFQTLTALCDLEIQYKGKTTLLKKGHSAFIPASLGDFSLASKSTGVALLTYCI